MIFKSIKNACLFILILFCSCDKVFKEKKVFEKRLPVKITLHTKFSDLENKYLNFNSPLAINNIAKIENKYFKDYEEGDSNYYGTAWREIAETTMMNDSFSYYDFYKKQLNNKPDSLHCTLYAYEALKAGLDTNGLEKLLKEHKKRWRKREIAGWSIGYILVTYFNWKAYHIVSKNAREFKHCKISFLKNRTYPVWRQPNIPLTEQLILEDDKEKITKLLNDNEFGLGFSNQGIHTWITRFDVLKECYWGGAPSKIIDNSYNKPLFIDTPFFNYQDYDSHVLIYPPLLNR